MDMNDRRSIRRYKKEEISQELLDELFTKAFRASNTGNMQAYSVIVTRDMEMKKKLAPLHFNQRMITEAPVVLTFCADFHRFSKWCEASDAEPCYDNFLSFFAGATDALLAAQTFAVAAEQVGLGLCYLGTTNYNAAEIAEVLQLPELVLPITTITVGYPDEMPAQSDRLPLNAVVHNEMYDDKQDIKALYAAKEALPENKAFVHENNKQTLAQVFTDIRYNRATNETCSEKLLAAIKAAKFLK